MFWLENWNWNSGVESIKSKYFFNQLDIDQAFLTISSEFKKEEKEKEHKKLWVYSLSSNCQNCPYQREGEISDFISNSERILKMCTKYPLTFRLRTNGQSFLVPHDSNDEEAFCDMGPVQLGQFGVYEIKAQIQNTFHQNQQLKSRGNCEFSEIHPPVNIFYPLLLAVIFYTLFLFLGLRIFKYFFNSQLKPVKNQSNSPQADNIKQNTKKSGFSYSEQSEISTSADGVKRRRSPRLNKNLNIETDSKIEEQDEKYLEDSSPRQRFDFIDIFRGICIFLMILANDGGAGYTFLQHANWDGLNLADVIFPWFLWIMGVSIPISLQFQSQKETSSRRQKIWTIFRRSCKMIVVGLFINLSSMWIRTKSVDLQKLRLPGVLQRFGICYFIASTLFIFGARRTRIGWILVLFLLLVHSCITFFLPVPGCPIGYLGPGGLHENGNYSPNCIGGAAGFVDRLILSENHMSRFPTAHSVYNPTPGEGHSRGQPFDPEGILATLTSLLQVWLGVQAGSSFLTTVMKKKSRENLRNFCSISTCAAVGSILFGLFLHTSNWIPINKNLWSLSFVLVTSGLAWLLLLFLYYVTEVNFKVKVNVKVNKFWDGSPFREMGLNPMLLYVGHSVCQQMNCLPFHWSIGRMSTHTLRLVETFWGLSLWILLALVCHHKKIYWVLR